MKWVIFLFSVLRPLMTSGHQLESPMTEFKEMIKANSVKVLALLAATSALATIFAAGIIIMAVDIGAQYDQNSYVYFSSMMVMGLTLSLVSLLVMTIAVRVVQDTHKREKREVLAQVGTSHPLQDALALLISDFIKERELDREVRRETRRESSREMKKSTAEKPSEEETTMDFTDSPIDNMRH